MNPNEQRIAIATACGWKHRLATNENPFERHGMKLPNHFDRDGVIAWWHKDREGVYGEPPDFCNSLDAMAQAEATLNPQQAHEMDRILQRIVFKQSTTDENWATGKGSINTLIWHASAQQRAGAFCQVIKATPPAAES